MWHNTQFEAEFSILTDLSQILGTAVRCPSFEPRAHGRRRFGGTGIKEELTKVKRDGRVADAEVHQGRSDAGHFRIVLHVATGRVRTWVSAVLQLLLLTE